MIRLALTGGLLVADAVASGLSLTRYSPLETWVVIGCFLVTALPTVGRLADAVIQGATGDEAEAA